MISIRNETAKQPDTSLLEKIAQSVSLEREVEVLLCNDKAIRELNALYRGIDKATDVLSFPYDADGFVDTRSPLGGVALNIDKAEQAACEYGHTIEEEIALLFLHGVLHLLGYDHEKDEGQMRQKEYTIVKSLNLPQSLIVRTEDR